MSSAPNNESYSSMRWVFKNAQNGFYLFTATPSMQRRVADYFGAYDIAVYDYGKNNAPYSFADLAKWTMQQKAKIFFIINMQIALREENDIINLNLSRDLLTKTDTIWVFGMTPDTDNRFVKIAIDFYSFIRLHVHFEDEYNEIEKMKPIIDDIPSDKYYDSYDEAKEQMNRYDSLCKELLALPMNAEPERLLSAAMTLRNIADIYRNYGDYKYAMKLYMHIKEIRETILGKEHPDTATTYNEIAGVYDLQGDYPKALEWYQKALDIREKVLGKEHPNTATTYNNIALVYSHQGDYHKALKWYCKSYRILLHALGESHPHAIDVKDNMKAAYFNTGASGSFNEWFTDILSAE